MAQGGMREMGQYNTYNGTFTVHTTHTLVHILHGQIPLLHTNILVHILHWYIYYNGKNTTTIVQNT